MFLGLQYAPVSPWKLASILGKCPLAETDSKLHSDKVRSNQFSTQSRTKQGKLTVTDDSVHAMGLTLYVRKAKAIKVLLNQTSHQ